MNPIPFDQTLSDTLEDAGCFVRGVMSEEHIANFFEFCSKETMSATGLESILEYEYDEALMYDEKLSFEDFVNGWLADKGLAYDYDDNTKIFTAEGINADSLSNVLASTGCPGAKYVIYFDGLVLSDNLAGDGAVVKPDEIKCIMKF